MFCHQYLLISQNIGIFEYLVNQGNHIHMKDLRRYWQHAGTIH